MGGAGELTSFEKAVLAKLLAGDHPILGALRDQLGVCTVTTREFTGHGFFTNLQVDRLMKPAPGAGRRTVIGDVGAQISGLEYGAGFLVFVTDGYLDFLEGYGYGEPWPQKVEDFSLSYQLARAEDPANIRVQGSQGRSGNGLRCFLRRLASRVTRCARLIATGLRPSR